MMLKKEASGGEDEEMKEGEQEGVVKKEEPGQAGAVEAMDQGVAEVAVDKTGPSPRRTRSRQSIAPK